MSEKEAVIISLTADMRERDLLQAQAEERQQVAEETKSSASNERQAEREQWSSERAQLLEVHSAELTLLKAQRIEAESTSQRLSVELAQLQLEAAALRSHLGSLTAQHSTQHDILAASQHQVSALIEQSERAASDSQQLAEQLSAAEAELAALTAQKAALETAAVSHIAEDPRPTEQQLHSEQKLQALQAELTAATQRLQEEEKTLQALTSAHAEQTALVAEQATANVQAEHDRQQAVIQQLQEQKDALVSEQQQLMEQLQTLTTELQTTKAAMVQASGQSGFVEAQEQQLTSMQAAIADKEATIARLSTELTSREIESSVLQGRLNEQKAEASKLIAELQAEADIQRQQSEQTIRELTAASEELKRQLGVQSASEQEVEQLRAVVSPSESQASESNTAPHGSSEHKENMASELDAVKSDRDELAQQAEVLQAQCATLRTSLATLTAELQEQQQQQGAAAVEAQLETANAQSAEMRVTLADQSQQLHSTQAALSAAQQELSQAQAEMDSKEAEVTRLTAELREKEAEVQQLSATTATLSQQATGAEEQQLTVVIVEREQQLVVLRETLLVVQHERHTMEAEVQRLTEQHQQANEQVTQLQLEAAALRSHLGSLTAQHSTQHDILAASQHQVSALIEQSERAASDSQQLAEQLSAAEAELAALTAQKAALETAAVSHIAEDPRPTEEKTTVEAEVQQLKHDLDRVKTKSEHQLAQVQVDRARERADAALEASRLQDCLESEQQAAQQRLAVEQEEWRCRIDLLVGRLKLRDDEFERLTVEQKTAEEAQQLQVQRCQQRLSEQHDRVEELEANLEVLQTELVGLDTNLHQSPSILPPVVAEDDEKLEAEQRSTTHSRTPSARQAMVEHALEIVRDELKQERRRMAALQDRLAHCVCEAASSSSDQPVRRRPYERTRSLPSSLTVLPFTLASGSVGFRRASLLPMTAANSLLFSSIHQSVRNATSAATASLPPSTLPSTHPLHEVTAELRSCYRMLQSEYSNCVESKLRLARVAANEVDCMRDELNAVRRAEWERVLAVDRVQRKRKRGDEGWHEAQEHIVQSREERKCTIM